MGHIYVCITVDWEGEELSKINDLIKIRKQIGNEIPFTHFICPNYFVSNFNNEFIVNKIKSAITPYDEVGLHIHCYKGLINNVPGVEFRKEQNYHNVPGWFEEKIVKKIIPSYRRNVSGRGVPLSVYSKGEIEKIITVCKELLTQHLQLDEVNGFRAGGWIANDTVLEVVEKLNFVYDSSAVAPSIFSHGFSKNNTGNKIDNRGDSNGIFTEHLLKLWGFNMQPEGFLKNINILHYNNQEAIQIHSQPFRFNKIIEIPNNCALTEFCSAQKTVLPLIKKYLQSLEQNPNESFVIVYGCHQEGDIQFKNDLLKFFFELSRLDTSLIKFVRMDEVIKQLNIPK